MSNWFPKNLLQWREPRALVRWRLDEELQTWSRRSRLLYVLLAPVMTLPPWLILWELDDSKALPPAVAIPAALGLGLVLVFGLPHLLKRLPSFVRIMEHGIVRSSHGTSWWTYDRIEQCSLGMKEIDGERISTLTVTPKKGKEILLGIDPGISPTRILELLKEKGVRLQVEASA
jgi:hypothetical protein